MEQIEGVKMKNILNEYVEKIKKKRHRYRRYTAIVTLLALLVVLVVNLGLRQDGISMTRASFFGQEEDQAGGEDAEKSGQEVALENDDGAQQTLQADQTAEGSIEEQKEESKSEETEETESSQEKASSYSDDSADLEEAADWEAGLPTEYSGNWAEDLISVAGSQLGYKESTANYRLSEDGSRKQGYTRYGEWYGNRYGDWSCMFVAFCLNYAGISTDYLPINSGAEAWIVDLKNADLYQDAAVYEPKEGDLVFLDQEEEDGLADHVGIITSLSRDENDQILSMKLIEGDSSDMVEEGSLEMGDSRILGYAKLPENPDLLTEEEESESADAKKSDDKQSDAKKQETGKEDYKAGEQTAETENYIVKVSYGKEAQISADATLKVTEFDRDSAEYKKAVKETGESYDWLLDISFYQGEKEIEPKSSIEISVTLKDQSQVMDEDTELKITHFAEDGTEVKEGDDLQLTEDQKGRSEVSFALDSLSLVGGQTYHPATVVAASDVTKDKSYLVYKASGSYLYFLAAVDGNPVTFRVALADLSRLSSSESVTADFASELGSTIYFDGRLSGRVIPASGSSYDGSLSYSNLLWVNENGSLKNTASSTYLGLNSSLTLSSSSQTLTFEAGSDTAYSRLYRSQNSGGGWGSWGGQQSTTYYYISFANEKISVTSTSRASFSNADFTLAQAGTDYTHSEENGLGAAVYTGTIGNLPVGFYSVTIGKNDTISALPGVVYSIYASDGSLAGSLTTTSDMRVDFSGLRLSEGQTYTMKMTSVPSGYLKDEETWSFTYSSSAKTLSLTDEKGEMTGIILINPDSKQEMEKTASVVDYANRTYQVDLSASSNLEKLKVEDLTVNLVVDQSNSMLFPADLQESNDGTLTVTYQAAKQKYGSLSNSLNKDEVYYAIADKTASATVWAIFYKNGYWWYQDASYYAKAYYRGQQDMIKTDDLIDFPTTNDYSSVTHGGKLASGCNMQGANLASVSATTVYTLYTAGNQYNRLHYLEESMSDMLQILADINPKATVTLDTFTYEIKGCDSRVLGESYGSQTGLEILLEKVGNITTDGGTRQDVALQHASTHVSSSGSDYMILITDGAPVSNNPSVGTATDTANATGTVYERINYQAQQLKNKGVTLATVGLGMKDVESGSKALRYISTNGPSTSAEVTTDHGEWWFQPENSSELISILCNQILGQMATVEPIRDADGTIKDQISDSFYPIDPATNAPLTDGTLIDAEGNVVSGNGVGVVRQDEEGGWYVEWENADLSQTGGWKGRVYLKAKEDFIGGNAIDTNKTASLTLSTGGSYEFEKPNVNVRLLNLNELSSSVTVYKGDLINEEDNAPIDSLQYFFDNTEFSKLVAGSGDVYNKVGKTEADGCKEASFTLSYALGRELTTAEWSSLKNGETLTLPYCYNEADGEVGYFTICLEKNGEGASYDSHEAEEAKGTGEEIESYTLSVVYTAYRLDGDKRPAANAHNGEAGPGTEVGSVTTSLEEGKGTVTSESIHKVYAIEGEIRVWKEIEDDLISDKDQTFTFSLYRTTDDGGKEQVGEAKTLTVKAGEISSDTYISFTGLERGSYSLVETGSDDYILEKIQVKSATNCQYTGDGSTEVTFSLGNNTSGSNVIGKETGARYTSYTDSPNGVLGEAVVTNKKQSYSTELPVKKVWDDSADHTKTPVYLVLYKDDAMVQTESEDGELLAQVIRLDAENSWQGSFTIPLTGKDDTDSPSHYSVRELKEISESAEGKQAASLVNDGSKIYFDTGDVLNEEDIAVFGGSSYRVYYSKETTAGSAIQTLVVTNSAAFELPKTGGMGTGSIKAGGLLLLAGALLYGYCLRRRRERRSR